MHKVEMASFVNSIRTPHGVIKEYHRDNISDCSRFDVTFDSVKDRIFIRVRDYEEYCYVVPLSAVKFMRVPRAAVSEMLGEEVPEYAGIDGGPKHPITARRTPIRAS